MPILKNSNIKSVLFFTSVIFLSSALTFGQTDATPSPTSNSGQNRNNENRGNKPAGENPNLENKKSQLMQKEDPTSKPTGMRCENRVKRIDNKIEMFKRSNRFQQERFLKIHTRVSNLIVRLEEKSIDVSQLTTDLTTLKTKIDTLNTEQQNLLKALEDLKAIECTDAEGLNNSLSEVKLVLADVRAATDDIRTFLGETLKADLADVKEELKALKPTEPTASPTASITPTPTPTPTATATATPTPTATN